jgi:hypothetical protein
MLDCWLEVSLHPERPATGHLDQAILCGGGLEYLRRSLASSMRRREGEPTASRYNWATLFLEDINTGGPGPPGWRSLE